MAQKMTDEEWRVGGLHGPRAPKISEGRAGGTPPVSPRLLGGVGARGEFEGTLAGV